jgi:hypothetical protein
MDTFHQLLQLALDVGLSPLNILLLIGIYVLWRRLVEVEDRTSENAAQIVQQSRLSELEAVNRREASERRPR